MKPEQNQFQTVSKVINLSNKLASDQFRNLIVSSFVTESTANHTLVTIATVLVMSYLHKSSLIF